jgi:hypothetical protein
MLSLHPSQHHIRGTPVSAPWFARPLPRVASPEAGIGAGTGTGGTSSSEDAAQLEQSFYEDEMVGGSSSRTGAAASFRNRYPDRCYKRQQDQQQQQQQIIIKQCYDVNVVDAGDFSEEDDGGNLPSGENLEEGGINLHSLRFWLGSQALIWTKYLILSGPVRRRRLLLLHLPVSFSVYCLFPVFCKTLTDTNAGNRNR